MDEILEFFSRKLKLCGYGKANNWSVRIADYFFVDCACCIFWRGMFIGGIIGVYLTLVVATVIFLLWKWSH